MNGKHGHMAAMYHQKKKIKRKKEKKEGEKK
jgi:hypothetical protein